MPTALPRPDEAWAALWNKSSVYDVTGAMRHGRRVGHVWFRPLRSVSLRRTGPIVLLNQHPWGAVDLDFHDNEVAQLHTIAGDSWQADQTAGTVSATIRFSQLRLQGNGTLQRGTATGSALKVAALLMRAPETLGATDDPNIVQAKNYQTQLTTSASGRVMLSTYYQHNDAYAQCFQNSKFVTYYQTLKTNGKSTADFAAQTSAAANDPSGTAVNGDVDYDAHAIVIQTMVVGTCTVQGNSDAGAAATQFRCATNTPSQTQQTMNSVMTIVSTTPPPSPSDVNQLCGQESESRIQATMRPDVQQAILEIEQAEDDMRRGIVLPEQTERPIHTGFRAYIETPALTISGTIGQAGPRGGPSVTFTKLAGPAPQVEVDLGVFPGALHAEVQAALGRASFVKALLGQRVLAALNDPALLGYLSRMMTLAMNESLGPVKA